MTQNLLARYGGPAPRYTSYPTAPHFHSGISGKNYQTWLSAIAPDDRLSLYLHVPFCQKMCWYCGCQTKVAHRYKPVSDYARYLAMEIELVASHISNRQTVEHIHWGGGTPTLLEANDFLALMTRIKTQFTIASNAEFAIEIDPRTMTRDKAENLAEAGINRVSLGVQDFNPHVQRAINRIQTFDQTKTVIEWLRNAGIDQVSLDLMYGLPKQTVSDALNTVDLTMDLGADRYSVFGYAHVPWMKTHQKQINETDLPSPGERTQQSTAISNRLRMNGYHSIGLDHYAKPDDSMAQALSEGTLQRNFQGYTTDTASNLIGLGASAIGRLKQGYVQNTSAVRSYCASVERGEFPIARGFELNKSDALRRGIIERLMCDYSINLHSKIEQSNANLSEFTSELERIKEMQDDGLVIWGGGLLEITDQGRPYVRSVCAVFDQYFDTGAGRHSLAV